MHESLQSITSSVSQRMTVFTAQSKHFFYCRDAICEFVFEAGSIPINPFRVFGYFLSDRVERDLVRQANNNLIRVSDELWVFGAMIANGVLFEIAYARSLGKSIRFFSVDNRASGIRPIAAASLRFEPELYRSGYSREDLLAILQGRAPLLPRKNETLRLFQEGEDMESAG